MVSDRYECHPYCATEDLALPGAVYGADDDPETVGLCAAMIAAHREAYPGHAVHVLRETVADAEARRTQERLDASEQAAAMQRALEDRQRQRSLEGTAAAASDAGAPPMIGHPTRSAARRGR